MVNEILHFEECCRTGEEPISSGRDNIETMKIILGIFESSRTGKAVDLDDLYLLADGVGRAKSVHAGDTSFASVLSQQCVFR